MKLFRLLNLPFFDKLYFLLCLLTIYFFGRVLGSKEDYLHGLDFKEKLLDL